MLKGNVWIIESFPKLFLESKFLDYIFLSRDQFAGRPSEDRDCQL